MSGHIDEGDDWDDQADSSDDGEDATVACRYCQRQIHHDSVQCPYCKNYISEEDHPAEYPPWWIGIGVLVCLYLVYRWIVP